MRPAGRQRRGDRAEDQVERDERDVDRRDVDRLGQGRRGQLAGVGPLHRHHARVARGAFRPAARDPRRERRRGVAPRCNRTSVKPPVEAPTSSAIEAGRVDLERVERRRELVAAAAHVRLGFRRRQSGRRPRSGRPACGRSRAASPSPTRTLPARTNACARLRDSTRPRSTSNWSSRHAAAWRRRDRSGRRRRTHPPIVAQPGSPGLTRLGPWQPHIRDLSTSTSQPGEDGSKPCSTSQRIATRLRSDHHARITSRSTSVP